jgi:hypothetical protein
MTQSRVRNLSGLVLAALGYHTLYVFYRRYVEALPTDIDLQVMRGTWHMGDAISIG